MRSIGLVPHVASQRLLEPAREASSPPAKGPVPLGFGPLLTGAFVTQSAARPSDGTLRDAALWAASKETHRAWVLRGMEKLGSTLAAWARDAKPTAPLFPDEVFSVISGGFDLGLTYDVDALALVHRCQELILPPDGNPLARTLLAGLRTPGSMLVVRGDRVELVPPTPETSAHFAKRMETSRNGRSTGGPLLPGIKPEHVWYDGVKELDVAALVGNVSPARRQVVERATALVSHRWQASGRNTLHGLAADGVWSDTPDETFITGGFARNGKNIGLPYFWGGFSDLESFDRGIAHGLPAGHIFPITSTYRQDNPFTPFGLGVDCSGFCAQAWNLDSKIATGEIAARTTPLDDYAQLQPGDIVMKVWQHVMLFVGRSGDALLFMESTPPRCIGQCFTADQLRSMEMLPRAATWLDEP